MRLQKNKKSLHIALAAFMALSGLSSIFIAPHVHAATGALAQTFVRFDRIKASTGTTGTVCARPTTTSADVKSWSVVFPTGFTLGAAATIETSNIDTSTSTSWPKTSGVTPTAWPNATSATAVVSSQTVTWTNGTAQTMSSGTTYCYNWTSTSAVTTSSASTALSGSVTTIDSTSTPIDSGQYATSIISNDQIVVTATVPPTFQFSLSGNTDDIGALTAGTVKPGGTPRIATVTTNSKNGWMVWGKDAWTGMKSATAGHTVPSITPGTNSTLTGAAEGYNTGVTYTVGSGSVTVDPAFVGGSLGVGGGLDTNQRLMATGAGVTTNAQLTLTNNMNVLASTPAATDYTDTITVTGAGLF